MSFPKKGKLFPNEIGYCGSTRNDSAHWYAEEIAGALLRSLGDSRGSTKVIASWTGANEKTVKKWFTGRYGPSGEHLLALARNSEEVLGVFLTLAGRQDLIVAAKLAAAKHASEELLLAVRAIGADFAQGGSRDPPAENGVTVRRWCAEFRTGPVPT